MRTLRGWLMRLSGMFRKERTEQEISDEIGAHLDLHIRDNLEAGMPPAEARRRANITLGGVEATKEGWRDQRGIPLVESFLRDVGYAFRGLGRSKGWSAVIVVSLGLGIGANTALFSVVDSVFLETVNVPNPGRLVIFGVSGDMNLSGSTRGYGYLEPNADGERRTVSLPFAVFEALRAEQAPLLEDVFSFQPARIGDAAGDAGGEPLSAQFVSGNYYRALGVRPIEGRVFSDEDDAPGAAPVAVVSEEYWRRAFGSDPSAIGSRIDLGVVRAEIVGVVPAGLGSLARPLSTTPDISIPMSMEPLFAEHERDQEPRRWTRLVMARARPGVSASDIEAYFRPVFEQTAREDALSFGPPPPDGLRMPAFEVRDGRHGAYEPNTDLAASIRILAIVFAIVLVAVCINLAGLLLSRYETRAKEMAVRLAMGASKPRLMRQLLTESLVLSVLGGALGLILALGIFPFIPVEPIEIDAGVFYFAVGVTGLATLFCGLAPALRSRRLGLEAAMKQGAGRATRSRSLAGKAMVVAQVSLSLVLLVGAGLLVRTVLNMQREPTGFDAADVVVFSVSVPTGASPTAMFRDPAVSERLETTLSNVLREVRARPGVRTAARATQPLLDGSAASYSIRVEGQSPEAPGSTARMEVTDGFFESLGIPLRFGRLFTAGDLESPTQAAVVNEAFVRDFFPDSEGYADIVGRRFSNEESSTEIVGVVGDVKYQTLREPAPPMVYLAARPTAGFPPFNFILKTDQPLDTLGPELRTAVARVDPNATIENMQTQRSLIAGRYREERLMATVASAFGALVLAVSMIGLFGLMSYTVARRTREVGIRMALGAPATSIRRSVIRESLVLVCLAIIPGLAASLAATRVIESTLFGLAPSDPSTILGAVALLLGISTLAAYLPARRASRVDPAITLREE